MKGGLPSGFGGTNPPDERKEGDANVRYIFGFNPDRGIFIVALVGLCYTIFGKRK